MSDIPILTKPRLLITVSLPEPDALELPLLQAFQHIHVILLGVYEVPEQASPEQAEEQFGDEAQAALERAAEALRAYEVELDTHLVFTGRVADTVKRIVDEERVDAVLYARPLTRMKDILAPLHSDQQQPRHVASFMAALVQESERQIRLRLLIQPEADADAQALLSEQQAAFKAANIDSGHIDESIVETDEAVATIIDLAESCDVLVLGELDPSLRERLFGEVHERIIPNVACPVVLVLYREEDG